MTVWVSFSEEFNKISSETQLNDQETHLNGKETRFPFAVLTFIVLKNVRAMRCINAKVFTKA